jgi:CubicO group peptidase (beta-lactamase class C family)
LTQFTRQEIELQGVPGAAVAVVANGELVYQQGFGFKDLAHTVPVAPDTLFGVGSVTKMLVATAALTLVEEGKLDLDAPINQYIPSFSVTSGDPSAIHVRHLLSHTSGLPDIDAELGSCSQDLTQWFADEAHRAPILSTPGMLWNYSGRGYMLAGLALEELSGESFEDAMRHRVFEPAGMGQTTFDPQIAKERDHSFGHLAPRAGDVDVDSYSCRATEPTGAALFASAPDMARFAQALLSGGGSVLASDSVAALETSQMATHQIPGEAYGLGLNMRNVPDASGPRVYYHGGNDGRFAASVALVPERGFAVIVLFNDTAGQPEVVSQQALELVLGIRKAIPVPTLVEHPDEWLTDPSTWGKYTGTYNEPHTYGRALVTLEDGKLWVEMVDGAPGVKMEMMQVADDYFHVSTTGMNVTYWFEQYAGAARYAVTRTGVFTRVE